MARQKLIKEEKQYKDELEDLIRAYYYNKSDLDNVKKVVEDENARIKQLMKEQNIFNKEVGNLRANYSVQVRETLNEDMLLEIMKKHNITSVIRKKEVVDMDLLERAMYNGEIPKNVVKDMENAKTKKEVVVLKVTKHD